MDRLWAGWRHAYVSGLNDGTDVQPSGALVDGEDGRTLFEVLADGDHGDEETFVVHRGPTCFAVLNVFPYTSGHLMVLPRRAVADLSGLTEEEYLELWATVRDAVDAVETALDPGGVNVGVNLGRAAGAGIPGHLHVHVVPRWSGDTNFTTTVANVRVLPEALDESWRRLREAWPR
ncbi:MAG: HIT domain-containing protein [Actinomycetota bacterium]|nr:HIT domain-containing protein [Actinomycetota bacterium]